MYHVEEENILHRLYEKRNILYLDTRKCLYFSIFYYFMTPSMMKREEAEENVDAKKKIYSSFKKRIMGKQFLCFCVYVIQCREYYRCFDDDDGWKGIDFSTQKKNK